MQIGRKIYYDKSTGNVLVDTGEMQGSVQETTQEQDFQTYIALQHRVPDTVGVVYLEFGQDGENFSKYPYHINIADNTIVWDTANPLGATLADVQMAKLAQIKDLYDKKLEAGFASYATGIAYTFGYGITDQMKFMQLAIGALSNIQPFPVDIPAKDNTQVSHTFEQYQALLQDIGVFANTQNVVQHQFIDQVNACSTIEEVNAIVVQF